MTLTAPQAFPGCWVPGDTMVAALRAQPGCGVVSDQLPATLAALVGGGLRACGCLLECWHTPTERGGTQFRLTVEDAGALDAARGASEVPKPQALGKRGQRGRKQTAVVARDFRRLIDESLPAQALHLPPEVATALAALPPPGPGDATANERRSLLRGALPSGALPTPDQLTVVGAWVLGIKSTAEVRAACAAVRLLRVRPPAAAELLLCAARFFFCCAHVVFDEP